MERFKMATLLFFASFSDPHSEKNGVETKRKSVRAKRGTES